VAAVLGAGAIAAAEATVAVATAVTVAGATVAVAAVAIAAVVVDRDPEGEIGASNATAFKSEKLTIKFSTRSFF
jgi:hypothetical protein